MVHWENICIIILFRFFFVVELSKNCYRESSKHIRAATESEFSSFQISSSALNANSNECSVLSSLEVLDLPGLDTTADNHTERNLFSQERQVFHTFVFFFNLFYAHALLQF